MGHAPLVARLTGALLEAKGITKRFGGLVAVAGLDLVVPERTIVGLIGPNGSGKSTLVNLISGELPIDTGQILLRGQDITRQKPYRRARLGIARSFQMLRLFPSLSVEDNLVLARHAGMTSSILDSILNRRNAAEEDRRARVKARALLSFFDLADFAGQPVGALSIGQQRMVELARGMMADPSLFILDEPAAGLSPPNVDRLIALIHRMREEFGMGLLLVEHDMRVVRDLCDHAVVLDSGEKIAEGTPADVVRDPAVIAAYIGSGHRRRNPAHA